jgi:hypothetical protein
MALASRELRYACEDKDKDRYDKCSAHFSIMEVCNTFTSFNLSSFIIFILTNFSCAFLNVIL